MESLWQDLRYSLRSLARSPGFTTVALVTLALGIGAATTMFSVVERLILHPLPYPNADRLVTVWMNDPVTKIGISPSIAAATRWKSSPLVERLELTDGYSWYYQGPGEARFVLGAAITPSLFSTLDLKPVLGRLLLPSDTAADAPRVVVIKSAFWHQEFGGRPNVLGTSITLDSLPYTIVGVAPDDIAAIYGWHPEDAWIPFRSGSTSNAETIIRLAAGVSEDRATRELNLLAKQAGASPNPTDFTKRLSAVLYHPGMVQENARLAVALLAGAVGLLLLIMCANVASLLLARASHRARELAVRKSLGATRRRLAQQPLIESLVLGVVGTGLGLWITNWAMTAIAGFHPAFLYQLEHLTLDTWVLWFSAVVAVGTSALFGTLPALQSATVDPNNRLTGTVANKEGRRSTNLQGRLVMVEMTLTTTMLLSGGLLVHSLVLETRADPGFRPEGLAGIEIRTPQSRYASASAREAYWRAAAISAEGLPGVQQAIAAPMALPFPTFVLGSKLDVPGKTLSESEQLLTVAVGGVTPGYLETLGIPILEGREFTADEFRTADQYSGEPASVIINQGMARRLWPGESPIGKRFRYFPRGMKYSTVVGVIRDDPTIWNDRPGAVQVRYPMPHNFAYRWEGWLMVRMAPSANATAVLSGLRGIARSLDPGVVVQTASTVPALLSAQLKSARFTTVLLAAFAGLALIIASVGLYGVLAYAVSQRTREIGIRIALGAETGSVVGLVVRQGLLPTGIGLALGTLGGVLLSRFFKALLYNTSGTDPVTMGAVVLVLALAALAASAVPARRAASVDPMIALRSE